MTKIRLRLPLSPRVNVYWRNWNGRTVLSKEARDFKREVALLCAVEQIELLPKAPTIVHLWVYREIDSGDVDARIKSTLDAFQGCIYEDDKQVKEIHCYSLDAEKGEKGYMLVELETLDTWDGKGKHKWKKE